jgi:hypothetical protein
MGAIRNEAVQQEIQHLKFRASFLRASAKKKRQTARELIDAAEEYERLADQVDGMAAAARAALDSDGGLKR